MNNQNTNPKDNKPGNKKVEELCSYAKSNKEEIGVYIALGLGILFLFFAPFFGELILGLLVGFYFSKELAIFFQNTRSLLDMHGRMRYTVLIGVIIGLLLLVPVLFITSVLTASVKQFFFSPQNP